MAAVALTASTFGALSPSVAAPAKKQTKVPPAAPAKAPAAADQQPQTPPPVEPQVTRLTPPLDVNDEIAALESVQLALTQVADGSTYVWHRSHGRLSGMVRPTASFKDHRGFVCRHVVVVLNGIDLTKKTEAIACRQADGVWELDG